MSIVDELIAILGFEVTGEDEARDFEKRLDKLSDGLDRFAVNAGRLAGAASVAVAGAFGLLGRTVIDTSAQFETYSATLETIEGSAEKAKSSLDWIAEFGKTTPYDVAQVTEAFVALKAYGIDPIANDTLRTLGDTASAMGKPLSQAVEALADAATGEFERLKEFGIRASQEGDNVTFRWTENGKELTETVKKSSNEIRAFLLETMGGRFSGAMDRQSRTWSGMISNLGDTWVDFQRRVGDAGFFATVGGHLQNLLNWIGRLDEEGKLDRWAGNLSKALSSVSNVIALIAGRIGTHVEFIIENFDSLQGPLTVIGVLFGILIARTFPLLTIFSALALIVDDFLTYLEGGESVIGDFIDKIKDVTGVSEGVAKAIAGLGGTVLTALASAFLLAPRFVTKLFGKLLFKGLVALAPLILKGAAAAFALISNPIGWAILLAGAALGLIYYFWDELVIAWDWLKDKAKTLFSELKDWFTDIDWAETGKSMGTALFKGLASVGQSIRDWFSGLIPDWAKDWFSAGKPIEPVTPVKPPTSPGTPFLNPKSIPSGDSDMMKNLEAYMAKIDAGNAVEATLNDSRQDNRQFPMTNTVNVYQDIEQVTDAPRNAAEATGAAVSGALPTQRSQAEMEPSF